MLSFAAFPDDTRAAGCAPTSITAVVGDYDGQAVPLAEAASRLRQAGVAAFIHTTKRHTSAGPRYRVIAPLAEPIAASSYPAMVDCLDGVLGGILAPESWESARCYFFGRLKGVEYQFEQVDGECIDRMPAGDAQRHGDGRPTQPGEQAGLAPAATETAQSLEEPDLDRQLAIESCTEETVADLKDALKYISSDDRKTWIDVGQALASLKQSPHEEDARELWIDWSQRSERYQSGDDQQWTTFAPNRITFKTVFRMATQQGWRNPRATQSEESLIVKDEPKALDWMAMPSDPPELKFVIPGWMPEGVVTLLAAHGGTGKSFLSIYIALCLATGRHPFAEGDSIRRTRVVLYSAEDSMPVLQLRIARYLKVLQIDRADLNGWLEVLDATDTDNVLFAASHQSNGKTTPRFDWLRARITSFGADVLIFDNASDAINANENDRAMVRQFMSSLKRIAPTVLLLAHVDAMSSLADPGAAKGYSGSTAWHNSARSRWFMVRQKDSEDIVLSLPKVNYAKSGSEVVIRWSDEDHVFRVVQSRTGRTRPEVHRSALLRLLDQAAAAGRNVSPSTTTPTSVYNTLKDMDGFPSGLDSRAVAKEVRTWQLLGLVCEVGFTRSNRTPGRRLVLTDTGRALCAQSCSEEALS
jgi:RecA-family ATPase